MNRWMSALGVSWLLVSACGGSVTHSDDTDSSDDETSASNGSGNNNSGNDSGSGSGNSSAANDNSANNNSANNNSANNNSANNNSANNNSSNGTGGDDTGASSGSGQATAVTVGVVGVGGNVSGFGGSGGGGSSGVGGGEFGGTGGWAGSGGGSFGSTTVSGSSVTGGGGNIWGDIPIPPECEGWVNNNGSSSCDMELECPSEWAWSYCNDEGSNFNCQCESDRNWGEYEISGVGIGDACPWAAAACVRAPEIVWDPAVCVPSFQEQGSVYCSAEAECTSSAMEGAVTISKREWLNSYCNQSGSGWDCSCDRPDRYTSLEFAVLPEGATCLNVLDWCNGGDIEPLGQVSCTPTYQSAGGDYCDAELECSYAVLVAGVEATLQERVPLNCQRSDDGTFTCQCSGTTIQSFPVMAADAWNACGEASSICAQTP